MFNYKYIFFLLCFLTFNLFFNCAFAKNIIKIGYVKNFGLINDINSYGHQGYGYELFKKIESYLDYSFEFIPVEMYEYSEKLNNGEIDLFLADFKHKDNEDLYEFGTPFIPIHPILACNKNADFHYLDINSINGKKISVVKNSPQLKSLNNFFEIYNVNAKLVYANDIVEQIETNTDFYLISSAHKIINLKTISIGEQNLYTYIAKKGNTKLINSLNEVIKILTDNGNFFLPKLFYKYYFHNDLAKPGLTLEQKKLLSNKEFSIAFLDNHQPYQFLDNDKAPAGLSLEILKFFAKNYNFKTNFLPFKNNTPIENIIDQDIIIFSLGNYDNLKKYFNFTSDYFKSPLFILSKHDIDLTDYKYDKIGILNYFGIDYDMLRQKLPLINVVTYYDSRKLLEDYYDSKIDSILITETGLEHALALLGKNSGKVTEAGIDYKFKFAISKKFGEQYVEIFNVLFDTILNSNLKKLYPVDILDYVPTTYYVYFIIRDNLWLILILALIIILIAFYFYHISQRMSHKAEIENLHYDSVTSAYSTYYLDTQFIKLLNRAKPNEYEIISLDINYFQTINSYYGYDIGSKVLITLAQNLIKNLDKNAIVARVIADRFMILRKTQNIPPMKYICETHIIPAIKNILGKSYNLALSVGSYVIENPNEEVNIIQTRANNARVLGKGSHTTTYNEFTSKMRKNNDTRNKILINMEKGLVDNEFKLFFQPKINLNSLKINGAEVLIRWIPNNGDKIYPDEFIPFFETSGFIIRLDHYIFEKLCIFIKTYKNKLNLPVISVNLSGISLISPITLETVTNLLKKYELTTDDIEIELTESAIIQDTDLFVEKIQELKNTGFTVVMDDFGAGISSLNRLSTMNVDGIKMDKAFLDVDVLSEKATVVVTETVIMTKKLNMTVVAEGVETAEQASWLQSIDCTTAQGYYFERPMPENEFIDLLQLDKQYDITIKSV